MYKAKQSVTEWLGDRHFWRRAFALALPVALQNFFTSSLGLVDTIMVGQLGDVSLSAVGMAGQWGWFLSMIIFGITSGAGVIIAQCWGVQDSKRIHRTFGIALLLVLLVALPFLLTGLLLPAGVMRIFNRNAAVVEEGSAYLAIACFSYPATAFSLLCNTVLRSTEKVKVPMAVSAMTTLLNALLNYSLIFGAWGAPTLGVRGAAIATCISSWTGALLLIVLAVSGRTVLHAAPRRFFSFRGEDIRLFIRKALPVTCNESMWGLGVMVFNAIFSNLGYEYFAAVTILRTFEDIAFVFFIGLCNACCVMVGNLVGAGEIKQAITDSRRFTTLLPLISVVLSAVIILLRAQLVRLFNFGDALTDLTRQTAEILLVIYAVEMPVRNIPYIQIVGIFRSGGDTVRGVRYDLCCLWCLSLPATLLAAYVFHLPFPVVYAVMYVFDDYLKSFLCLRYFRSYRWLKPVTDCGKKALDAFWEEKGLSPQS